MGGPLSEKGLEYAASGYVWPPEGGYRVIGPIKKPARLLIGFFHVVAAFVWFGAILYVHIMLKPAYAEKGLPRGEVGMGLVSMVVVGVTGALLTVSRIKGVDVLFTSPWGLVLSVKIFIYLVMVCSALFVVLFVGPRLRKAQKPATLPEGGVFDPLTLAGFDGREGRPALIAYKDRVYDVTGLRLWKNGLHMKHQSGSDLTALLTNAPHGEEKLENLTVAGSFDAALKPGKTVPQKIFHFVAYMNLALVFLVLLTIAWWRWGI
jgi:predicted heme/steroid binding protein